MRIRSVSVLVVAMTAAIAIPATSSAAEMSGTTVAELDVKYQAAVKHNDATTMDRILADDFVLVTGKGTTFTKADLLADARAKTCTYEQQDEVANSQTVRVFGHATAVVTAQLWEKGTCQDGSMFDSHLWFSDTYVKADGHWHYVFGQASRPL